MSKRRLYRKDVYGSISNTSSQNFQPKEPHDPRYVLYVTTGSIEDSTSAPTNIAFGKLVNGVFTPLEEIESPSAGIRYHVDKTHHFLPGEEPAFRIEGGTSADVIVGYVEGYEEEV